MMALWPNVTEVVLRSPFVAELEVAPAQAAVSQNTSVADPITVAADPVKCAPPHAGQERIGALFIP